MIDNSTSNKNYRLYYNQDGTPRFYSMENVPGDYILVDRPTFECGRYDITVKDGKIQNLSQPTLSRYVIVNESTETSISCDPYDITLITTTESEHIFWDHRSE